MSEVAVKQAKRAHTFAIATVIVGALGVLLSLYLAYHHNKATSTPGYTSFCSINQTIDCDAVNASKQSEIVIPITSTGIRIPVALLSLIFYIALTWLAFVRFRAGQKGGLVPISYAFFMSLFGVLFTLGMAYVSFFVLEKVCLFCSGLYIVGIAFPIAAWLAAGSSYNDMIGSVLGDLRGNTFQRVVVAVLGLFIVFLGAKMPEWFSRQEGGTNSLSQIAKEWKSAPKALVGTGDAYRKGASDAPVTVIEFADFECPACRAEASEVRKLMKKYPGLLQVYFRHMPLDQSCNPKMPRPLHQHACITAKAAECAGIQGRFWEYHDRVYTPTTESKPKLDADSLRSYAEELGLDTDSFNDCLDNDRSIEAKISADIEDGAFAGVHSTPTLIINGKKMARPLTVSQWEEILRIEKLIDAQDLDDPTAHLDTEEPD